MPGLSVKDERIVRLSFNWVIIGILGVLLMGIFGGIISHQILSSNVTPLPGTNSDKVITTIQQITISPNTAAAEMVKQVDRSVMLLAPAAETRQPIVATAAVVTSDGLLATTARLANTTLIAYDFTGHALKTEYIGTDTMYGLTFLKVINNVVVPLDTRRQDAPRGENLLLLSRNIRSFKPYVQHFMIHDYDAANIDASRGIQIIARGDTAPAHAIGAPVLDDNGHIAGLVLDAAAGLVMPMSQIQSSLDRLTAGVIETDVFTDLGLDVTFDYTENIKGELVFTAKITKVAPRGIAQSSGLLPEDVILEVNGAPLDPEISLARLLKSGTQRSLTIKRSDLQHTIAITL